MAILRVTEGKTTELEYQLGPRSFIGRGEENEIRIFDETSSRRHAEIVRAGESFTIEDLGSSNGTYVNQTLIEKSALVDGDEIAIGGVRFSFLLAGQGGQATVLVSSDVDLEIQSKIPASDYKVTGGDGTAADVLRKALEIQALVSSTLDPEEVMERICQALLDHVGGDRSAVLSASRQGSAEPLAVRRTGGESGKPFILSRTIVGEVVSQQRALLISDSSQDPVFQGRESLVGQNVSSAICVPIVEGDHVTALLYLDRTQAGSPYTDTDLHMALAIAEQAAPAIHNARQYTRLSHHAENLEKVLHGEPELVGSDTAFLEVVEMARRVAEADSTVLVTGETGTGKELVARLVHLESNRRHKPFVPVNCAALVGTLLESELFGHEKGAFTGASKRKPGRFELAEGGTLFLDEIGEMPAEVQAKVLRAIQEKAFYRVGGTVPVEVDIRIIAATNRDLTQRIETGEFRTDLYYRLSVVTLEVPPLRERPADIEDLAEHFLLKCAAKTRRPVEGFSSEAMEKLKRYTWPGNARELENIVERAVVLTRGRVIGTDLIPVGEPGSQGTVKVDGGPVMTLKEAECRAIEAALRHTKWKKGETAKLLGTSWPTLNKKIQEYGITKDTE